MSPIQLERERYLRDPMPVRLGGIASNLVRVRSLTTDDGLRSMAETVLRQTGLYIEWTASDADPSALELLAEIQRSTFRWRKTLPHRWSIPGERLRLGIEAGEMGERVLDISGLLDAPTEISPSRKADGE